MVRTLFLVFLLLFISSSADEWKPIKSVSLQKDQLERIVVQSGALKRLFEFRWTLYADDALVILRSYDDDVAQHVLRSHYKNRSFRVELLSRGGSRTIAPYFLVTFKHFDFKANKALFDIYLSDDDEQVELKFLQETM